MLVSHKEVRDKNWSVNKNFDNTYNFDQVKLAVLLDIREELKSLNRLLHCSRFIDIPLKLELIENNTRIKKIKTYRK